MKILILITVLTIQVTFCEGLENYERFFDRASVATNSMTHLHLQKLFGNQLCAG